MNFSFLIEKPEYALFARACVEAERTLSTSAAMCAIGARKGLELAVKWVYDADAEMREPYRDNLSSLLHERTFRDAIDPATWSGCRYVVRLGNQSVHTDRAVRSSEAMYSLRCLFAFVEWVDYCYGTDYVQRTWDENEVPSSHLDLDEKRIRHNQALVVERDERIAELEEQVRQMRGAIAAAKTTNKSERTFNPDDIPEYETRKRYIDLDLEYSGWSIDDDVITEYEVNDMEGNPGQQGFVDYVLEGRDGKPLALIEAKRTAYDPTKGLQQARLYADCLERKFGIRPFVFLSNGFTTTFVDDEEGPERQVSGVFSADDLRRLRNRKSEATAPSSISVNKDIAGRYYQVRAINAVCKNMESGRRRHLLVMPTGTGKTRTAAGLADLLMRAGHVTNALFLADRRTLVSQAKSAFREHLPNLSLCNLCDEKDKAAAATARMVFSTYPSILNAIDEARSEDGSRAFGVAHFDLIIVDEAHRSIFRKYRAIFEYFDAQVVGLTATPKDDVDRNTYDFFEVERGVPTDAYEYEVAVNEDHYILPYHNIEVSTKFLSEGITYDDLSEDDKERYDEDFEEQVGTEAPDFVPTSQVDKFVFNEQTIDSALQDLMDNGVRTHGGETLGKTIVFARNRPHAKLIVERFGKLYPTVAKGGFIRRVTYEDDYSESVIKEFKKKEQPTVVVSVDMMDTGVDVPAAVNLVMLKQVKSSVKFWQMLGRGCRTCEGLWPVDSVDGEYEHKRRFFVFDYCGNFEFFRAKRHEREGRLPKTLSEAVFCHKAELVRGLQDSAFANDEHQLWRSSLVSDLVSLVSSLDREHFQIKLRIRSVDKFSQEGAYEALAEQDLLELERDVAPLVHIDEEDEFALRFDALMYGLMCAVIAGQGGTTQRSRLSKIAYALESRSSIPQVRKKLPVIQRINEDGFLDGASALQLEQIRLELRELYKFLADEGDTKRVITSLNDPILARTEGESLEPKQEFEAYRMKVNRYIREHSDDLVIHKLRNNLPLTSRDIDELERVLTQELGTKEDYDQESGGMPFGLFVRRITKLDHHATMDAFAEFLNDGSLSAEQMAFVERVVRYVEEKGYMDLEELVRPPFDRPAPLIRLFGPEQQRRIVEIVKTVRSNAASAA